MSSGVYPAQKGVITHIGKACSLSYRMVRKLRMTQVFVGTRQNYSQ